MADKNTTVSNSFRVVPFTGPIFAIWAFFSPDGFGTWFGTIVIAGHGSPRRRVSIARRGRDEDRQREPGEDRGRQDRRPDRLIFCAPRVFVLAAESGTAGEVRPPCLECQQKGTTCPNSPTRSRPPATRRARTAPRRCRRARRRVLAPPEKVFRWRAAARLFPRRARGGRRGLVLGNEKHNPGEPMHHARGKSMDHADCIMRHLVGRGGFDGDTRESAALAWRALALLQEELEREHGLPLPRAARG
jgi:hypothetical protein